MTHEFDSYLDGLTDEQWSDLLGSLGPEDAAAMNAAFGPPVPAEWPELDIPPVPPEDVPF